MVFKVFLLEFKNFNLKLGFFVVFENCWSWDLVLFVIEIFNLEMGVLEIYLVDFIFDFCEYVFEDLIFKFWFVYVLLLVVWCFLEIFLFLYLFCCLKSFVFFLVFIGVLLLFFFLDNGCDVSFKFFNFFIGFVVFWNLFFLWFRVLGFGIVGVIGELYLGI